MKYFISAIYFISSIAFAGESLSLEETWQSHTTSNLHFMYNLVKTKHPRAKDPCFKFGSALGISLDKVKKVVDENGFLSVMTDFVDILNDSRFDIISNKDVQELDSSEILELIKLPHGNLSAVIKN